jgi:hypothetical protein
MIPLLGVLRVIFKVVLQFAGGPRQEVRDDLPSFRWELFIDFPGMPQTQCAVHAHPIQKRRFVHSFHEFPELSIFFLFQKAAKIARGLFAVFSFRLASVQCLQKDAYGCQRRRRARQRPGMKIADVRGSGNPVAFDEMSLAVPQHGADRTSAACDSF